LFEETTRYILRPHIAEVKVKLKEAVRKARGGLVTQLDSDPQLTQESQKSAQKRALPTMVLPDDVAVERACEHLDRALIAYDGAYSQVNRDSYDTFMPGHLADSNEVFKWPAATSLSFQWGDACHGHKEFKSETAKVFNTTDDQVHPNRYVSPQLVQFVRAVLSHVGLSAGSLKTYSRFFFNLEDIISKVWTRRMIAEGFRLSGAQVGLLMDRKQILSRSSGCWLEDFTEEQREEILSRTVEGATTLDALAQDGELKDKDIDDEFSDIAQFDPGTEKPDDAAMNNKRCLWLTNPRFVEARKQEKAAMLMAFEEKRRLVELRRVEKERKDKVKADKDEERMRQAAGIFPQAAAAGTARVRRAPIYTVKCSNCLCPNTCFKGSDEHKSWSPCTDRQCKALFCIDCCNAGTLSDHVQAVHSRSW
jgi:hypothetical protein